MSDKVGFGAQGVVGADRGQRFTGRNGLMRRGVAEIVFRVWYILYATDVLLAVCIAGETSSAEGHSSCR